jgi:hypothetical protein
VSPFPDDEGDGTKRGSAAAATATPPPPAAAAAPLGEAFAATPLSSARRALRSSLSPETELQRILLEEVCVCARVCEHACVV